MVHLICLRCNRANTAEAKFCSECGAGLLRKFCTACHAVNDAESHFCQSCGKALPAAPPQASVQPPSVAAPTLTDVAFSEQPEPARPLMVAPVQLDAHAIVELPPQLPVLAADAMPPRTDPAPPFARAYRVPIALGACGALALALAWWLWPRPQPPLAISEAAAQPPRALPAAPAAVVAPLAVPARSREAAAVAAEATAAAALQLAPPAAAANEAADKPPPRRVRESMAAAPVAVRPAAERAVRAPLPPPRPSTPATECTPAIDAMGLCPPDTKVTGR